jgi:hypothetical protein
MISIIEIDFNNKVCWLVLKQKGMLLFQLFNNTWFRILENYDTIYAKTY